MASIKKNILIITPFFSPNIGGVESHLIDLIKELNQHKIHSTVLTYSPLTTNLPYLFKEKIGYCRIYRFRWFGKNLFHTLEKFPLFDFLYLTPYLLLRSLIWLSCNHKQITTIHSQGINATFIGNILAKVFHKRHITSTHAVYDHIHNLNQKIVVVILNHTDKILCLSQSSQKQLISWGVNPQKISLYRYWIDLKKFTPAKVKPKKLTFIFVGRLIKKKGIILYLKLAQKFSQYNFLVIGTGPEKNLVLKYCQQLSNLKYLGTDPIYQQASVLLTPSLYQEGYGRVVMEAVACGLPVIASNYGGLTEALDNSVAILIKPTFKNFSRAIEEISQPSKYQSLQKKCRHYALNKFSSKNFDLISRHY